MNMKTENEIRFFKYPVMLFGSIKNGEYILIHRLRMNLTFGGHEDNNGLRHLQGRLFFPPAHLHLKRFENTSSDYL